MSQVPQFSFLIMALVSIDYQHLQSKPESLDIPRLHVQGVRRRRVFLIYLSFL